METGPQGEPFVAEPLEDPFKRQQEQPAPAQQPAREQPVKQPA